MRECVVAARARATMRASQGYLRTTEARQGEVGRWAVEGDAVDGQTDERLAVVVCLTWVRSGSLMVVELQM